MLDKKWMVLAIFFIALVAISGVSAAEDAGDVAAIENNTQTNAITNDIATDEIQDDTLKLSVNDESDDALAASNNEEILTDVSECYVNSSYSGNEYGTYENPYSNLYNALNAEGRKDGDIIHIAAGEYTGIGSNIGLAINNNLTFDKYGFGEVIFDAKGEKNFFDIYAEEIKITGITFKNGMSDDCGGALIFQNGLKNSLIGGDFINNTAPLGGAILIKGIIENSIISAYFANNHALMGGAIFAPSIINTTIDGDFFNNTAGSLDQSWSVEELLGCGGAIFVEEVLQNSSISGSFLSNGATNLGGAIFAAEMLNSNVTSTFKENYALMGGAINAPIIMKSKIDGEFSTNVALIGGAISTGIVNGTEIGSEFIGNTADFSLSHDEQVKEYVLERIISFIGEYVDNVTLVEEIGQYLEEHDMPLGFGGAISVVGIVENSAIVGKFADNNGAVAGGALCVLGLAIKDDIVGNFTHNHAGIGGSLWLSSVEYSNIIGEFSSSYAVQGGAIFANVVKNVIINGSFMENLAINNEDLIGADKLAWGGAICIDGILKDSSIEGYFVENMANELGGAIGGIDFVINSNISGYFIHNIAKIGGAIDAPYLNGSTISGIFANNTAAIGGAIMAVYINNTQINANFINNNVLDYDVDDGEEIEYGGFVLPTRLGGAMCIAGALENSIFTGEFALNKAKAGGALLIYTLDFVSDQDYIGAVKNNTFNSNFLGNVAGLGAAILINGTSLQNKFNSNFITNGAVLDGIVYLCGESIEDSISGCLFMNNTAENSVLSVDSASGTNITYNIFLDSDSVYDIVANGERLCLDNNWFGHNATNYMDSPKVMGYEFNNWLFLNAIADPDSVSYMGTSNIVFTLFVYDNSTKSVVGKCDYTLLEPVNLTIVSTNGNVDKKVVTFGDAIKFSSSGNTGTVTAVIGTVQDTIEITCLPTLFGKDLVMDYLGNNYKIQVFDANGNPAAGETVKMTVNGVTYAVKVDKNGYATLTINLKPKTYTITSTYKGTTLKNTIKVKNTLKTQKSFSVKKTAKKLVLKATLKWSNGKAIAGKKVSFKINGKSFIVKTDKRGIAKITFAVKVKKTIMKLIFNKKTAKVTLGKTYKVRVHYKNETASSKLVVKK